MKIILYQNTQSDSTIKNILLDSTQQFAQGSFCVALLNDQTNTKRTNFKVKKINFRNDSPCPNTAVSTITTYISSRTKKSSYKITLVHNWHKVKISYKINSRYPQRMKSKSIGPI